MERGTKYQKSRRIKNPEREKINKLVSFPIWLLLNLFFVAQRVYKGNIFKSLEETEYSDNADYSIVFVLLVKTSWSRMHCCCSAFSIRVDYRKLSLQWELT